MDSLSQLALGAAVGVAVMGRRTAPWKAALWGGVCGTLPDLDSLIDHGDPVSNMTLHRAETHALFWLTLVAPLFAWLAARLHGEMDRFRRWWFALWLALITHPLLDAMTVYGTRLALPFSDHPYAVGSMFIIDPLYTLPLLVGVLVALSLRDTSQAWRWNLAGLLLSTAYLGWSFLAQQHVASIAAASLRAQDIAAQRVLVTPAPFNTLLWRIVALTPESFYEGYASLLDSGDAVAFERFDRGAELQQPLDGNEHVSRLSRFSQGFVKFAREGAKIVISDLRMGQEPYYTFSFAVAEQRSAIRPIEPPVRVGRRLDLERGLPWLWRRMLGEPIAPPR